MQESSLQAWLQLPDKTKLNIFEETAKVVGIPTATAVEKDWWVVQALTLIFQSSIAAHTVFKGGTSLSKGWKLIDRFSEDIDLALDRGFLGFDKEDTEMSISQVNKLRRKSFKFIQEVYLPELISLFQSAGLSVRIEALDVNSNDHDPLKLAIYYHSLTESIPYLQPRVLVEIGSRSLIEPFELRSFSSWVGAHFAARPFADAPISVPTVTPDRTFLEKIFLLHEEFQLPGDRIRVDRKSRHHYDLEKLMDTAYAHAALSNPQLYQTIVVHRKAMTPLRGIDYALHAPAHINPVPPNAILQAWESDYKAMRESMIYTDAISFDELMARMAILKNRVNALAATPDPDHQGTSSQDVAGQ